ncbi:MAG: glycosyl hydrolase 53 family protein [Muribaculaceae bacterium]|nr:glycosyl hydrolase 53 family protein [Muribaculaceae bacterium]
MKLVKIAILTLALALTTLSANAATRGDVNGDNEVNIADVNALIDMILKADAELCGDVNDDGEVNIADVNALIDIILSGGEQPEPYDGPVVGGDISMLTKYEAHQLKAKSYGITTAHYYDQNGRVIDDVITWTKQQGWNAARVRLFVNPANASTADKGQGVIQNLDTVKVLGARIKAAGMQFMLDFHYSDSWADPVKQFTPAEWADLDDEALTQKVYEYTRDCLRALKAAGATPDYIQTGNEISYGMLWGPVGTPSGDLKKCYMGNDANWDRFANLLKAAGRACREECPQAKIILHTERVAKTSIMLNFYNQMKSKQVDYDIIGLSYYPYFHGDLATLGAALNSVGNSFQDKDIMIVETGYSYHYKVGDLDFSSTWPLTAEGQRKFTVDLIARLKPYAKVKGLFWWFPEANEYGLGGNYWNALHVNDEWYNAGLWNHETGRATPALYELKDFLE